MEVSQVLNVADWYLETIPAISKRYNALKKKLDHNKSQPQKEPLREELDDLIEALEAMYFDLLTNEELDLLGSLNALQYLGHQGARFVSATVRTSDFDPASAASDISTATQVLNSTQSKFDQARTQLRELGLERDNDEGELIELPLIRVRFKDGAAVDDVTLLKKWISDWFDISRGAALAAGEKPHSVKVVGASNGSVIITLGTIASVTMILAVIAKNAGRIAHEYLSIANDIEDLRQKKRLNKVIEDELKQQQTSLHETGVEDTLSEIKETVPLTIEQEVDNALRKSIEKYFSFYQKGGDVDFIPPRTGEEYAEEGEEDQNVIAQIQAHADENDRLVDLIENVRAQEAEIKELTNHTAVDD